MKWILSTLLIFPSFLYAETCSLCSQEPLTCPPRNWVITLGIAPLLTQDLGGNYYGGFQGEYAGTMNLWTFTVGPIVAASVTEAYTRLNLVLPTITTIVGPLHLTSSAWVCYYNNLSGIQAVAYTPPVGCFNPTAP